MTWQLCISWILWGKIQILVQGQSYLAVQTNGLLSILSKALTLLTAWRPPKHDSSTKAVPYSPAYWSLHQRNLRGSPRLLAGHVALTWRQDEGRDAGWPQSHLGYSDGLGSIGPDLAECSDWVWLPCFAKSGSEGRPELCVELDRDSRKAYRKEVILTYWLK